MRIDFEFEGGYAGLQPQSYHADTDDLQKELAEELLKLVESSGVFDLQQEVAPASDRVPDVFSYRLSLSEGTRKKSLSFNDVSAPATLHPLLALLRKLALAQKRKGK